MIRTTLFAFLLLTLVVGAAVALGPETSAVNVVAPDQPELGVETLELAGMLNEEAPLMSVEPERTESADATLPTVQSWPYGICYPNTCFPCLSDADCPLRDRCVFGVFCP